MTFYKTTIVFEVLHDDSVPIERMNLADIIEETINGHASGMVTDSQTVELTKEATQQALVAQGSDPHFLDMEEEQL